MPQKEIIGTRVLGRAGRTEVEANLRGTWLGKKLAISLGRADLGYPLMTQTILNSPINWNLI